MRQCIECRNALSVGLRYSVILRIRSDPPGHINLKNYKLEYFYQNTKILYKNNFMNRKEYFNSFLMFD